MEPPGDQAGLQLGHLAAAGDVDLFGDRVIALSSFAAGLGRVLRAPGTVAGAIALTLVTAVPFGLVMGQQLQSALNDQPPVMLGSEEIDADWWLEYRRAASGLAATFTPAIIGFAAPLSNLSALLDGTAPGRMMVLPIALAIVTWAFIWGLAIERFRDGGARRAGSLISSGLHALPSFVAISAAAAAAQLLLYVTIHPLLFGPLYAMVTELTADERVAFLARIVLYLVFGVCVAAVGLAADYARIASRLGNLRLRDAGAASIGFLRRRWPSAAALFLITTAVLGVAFLLYGVGEAYGGSRVAGWRGVVIGQAFVIGRIALRLVAIAAEVRLYERAARS
jgi:hypothetical protein